MWKSAWDTLDDPLVIEVEGVECANVFELCKSDNMKIDRVVTVLADIALEVRRLKRLVSLFLLPLSNQCLPFLIFLFQLLQAEDEFYGPISLFGEHIEPVEGAEALPQLMFGRMIPFFQVSFLPILNDMIQ